MYYLNGGVGQLEGMRKPLLVNRATYERARSRLVYQPFADRLNPARRQVWSRAANQLYQPYWTLPDHHEKDPLAPKSDLLYTPYWMSNKSRARLIQRPSLQLKPRSHVLYHLGTDEEDGLGKGFNPLKAVKRAVHFTPTSFQPKKIFGAIGSVAGTIATGGLGPIVAPKVFSANSKTMKSLGMAVSAIAVVAGGVVLGPAIAASLGPMLSSGAALAGKAVTGMTTFMKAFSALSPKAQQAQGNQLTAQQIAAVETGQAQLTEQGLTYTNQQPPGSLMAQGQMAPLGPASDMMPQGYPPSPGEAPTAPAEAGMLGGLSLTTIGLMVAIPLAVQLLTKKGD